MGYCDICNAVGSWETISANNFQKAIKNGFNPVSLQMFNPGLYTPESWKLFAQSPMVATTAWALCTKCMVKLKPYLNEKDITTENKQKEGCFIATACYGDYNTPELLILREFRDDTLLESKMGQLFVCWYYKISPPVATFISKNNFLKKFLKLVFIKPLTKIVAFLFIKEKNHGAIKYFI
jgi:hypothetical protein